MEKGLKFDLRLKAVEEVGKALTDIMDREEYLKVSSPQVAIGLEKAVIMVRQRFAGLQEKLNQQAAVVAAEANAEEDSAAYQEAVRVSCLLSNRAEEALFILNELERVFQEQQQNTLIQNGKFEGAVNCLRVVEGLFSAESVKKKKWEADQEVNQDIVTEEGMSPNKARALQRGRDAQKRRREVQERKKKAPAKKVSAKKVPAKKRAPRKAPTKKITAA